MKLSFKKQKTDGRQSQSNISANRAFSYYRSSRAPEPRISAPIKNTRGSAKWRASSFYKDNFRDKLRYLPEIFAALVVAVSVVNLMLLSPKVIVVAEQKPSISTYRPASEYISVAETTLKKSFRSRLKLFVQPEKVKAELLTAFPEVAMADVSIPVLGQKAVIYLSLYTPIGVIDSNGQQFILASSGHVMKKTPQVDSSKLLPIRDESTITLSNGASLFSASQMRVLKRINDQLVATGLTPESFILPKVPYEIDARLVGKNYFVKFNLQGEGDAQVGALKAVMQKLDAEPPAEYVDLRVEDKVYYK